MVLLMANSTVKLLWPLLHCFCCLESQCCPIVRHKMTRCHPLSHLTLPAKLLIASPLMSFLPSLSHVFVPLSSPRWLSILHKPLQLFSALFLGASVRIRDESGPDWQNQEQKQGRKWCCENGRRLMSLSSGKQGWMLFPARMPTLTPARRPKTDARTSGDGAVCTTTVPLQTELVINTVVTSKWESVSVHHSQHKFCKNLGRGF